MNVLGGAREARSRLIGRVSMAAIMVRALGLLLTTAPGPESMEAGAAQSFPEPD